jgi:low temperature requirement protein LtrA
MWFAGTYVAVRVLGLLVYDWVASDDASQRVAVRLFSFASIAGMVAVLVGGFVGGAAQYAWWSLGIALDLVAAAIGARADGWNIHPDHFSERHGLFVIIALGESVIVAAISLAGGEWPMSQVLTAMLAVAIAGAMWWTYFVRNKHELDHAFESVAENERAPMARDTYSVIHFPIVLGIIAFAATVEHALGHPSDPLGTSGRALLAASVLLFASGMSVALWRAGRPVPTARLWLPPLTAAIVFSLASVPALMSLAVVLVGYAALGMLEPVRVRHLAAPREASAAE